MSGAATAQAQEHPPAVTQEGLWSELNELFPGQERIPGVLVIPGQEVRIILSRVVPNFDHYYQILSEHLDSVTVTRGDGRMRVDVSFLSRGVNLEIEDFGRARTGQPYRVSLSQRMRFDLSMRRDTVLISNIRGIEFFVKLPFLPDGIWPRRVQFDTSRETLEIDASGIYGLLRLVARVDVRERRFSGVNLWETILRNLPFILQGMTVFPRLPFLFPLPMAVPGTL